MEPNDFQAQIDELRSQISAQSNSSLMTRDNETALRERLGIDNLSTNASPIGSISAYGGATAPTGWLLCNGTGYATSQYPALYAVIGTTYGSSGGFQVPDLRANVPAGYKSGDANFGTLGATAGEATHTLSISEMPSHNHTGNYGTNVWNTDGARATSAFQGTSPVTLVDAGITAQGGGAAHNNIQPSLTVNWIIKY